MQSKFQFNPTGQAQNNRITGGKWALQASSYRGIAGMAPPSVFVGLCPPFWEGRAGMASAFLGNPFHSSIVLLSQLMRQRPGTFNLIDEGVTVTASLELTPMCLNKTINKKKVRSEGIAMAQVHTMGC